MKKSLFVALFALVLVLRAQEPVKFTRTEEIIYGHKFGTALTLDVFEPARKNGGAILWVVSGGFVSTHDRIDPSFFPPLLERGYTVFAIVHGSQPRFIIPEIEEDIHRAVRFVRHNAARWGIDRKKFGISGDSSGGHLSLKIGTQGQPGNPNAKDPVDRESSVVQAVACFFPPTDFLNWTRAEDDQVGVGDVGSQFNGAFGARAGTAEGRRALGGEISPINFVTANMPPTLIIQGDEDQIVPLYQAKRFERRCKEVGAPLKLIVKPHAGHGYPGFEKDTVLFANWFDAHHVGGKAR